MPKAIAILLLLAGFLTTPNLPAAGGLLSRLLGDRCFDAYAGAIGDRPITLLIRGGPGSDGPTAWYYLDDTGQYDAVANRFRYPVLHLQDDASQGDRVCLLERADDTGTIIGRFAGRLDGEGRIAGEWRPDGVAVALPFWLQPRSRLPQGRHPAFSIHIREGVLEIEGEERVPIAGDEGLVTDPWTDCGPDPFSLSVRRLRGPPDLYLIETEEPSGPPVFGARDWVFVRPGAIRDPLHATSQFSACSTTAGLGCDCTDNEVRYSYGGGVLTVIDEQDQTSDIEPDSGCGCWKVDRTLQVLRVEAATGAFRLDKLVELSGLAGGDDCREDGQGPSPETTGPTQDAPSPTPQGQATPALRPRLFDDGISAWLLLPKDAGASVFRINQSPGDPGLEIQPVKQTLDGQGPVSAEHYNGPDTPLKAACWLYNRTETPGRFQQRSYPPASLANAFRPTPGATSYPPGASPLADLAYGVEGDASWGEEGFGMRWSTDGTAAMVQYRGEPLMLFDGEHCYHRHPTEPGRWGMPWSDPRYADLFGPAEAATAGD